MLLLLNGSDPLLKDEAKGSDDEAKGSEEEAKGSELKNGSLFDLIRVI